MLGLRRAAATDETLLALFRSMTQQGMAFPRLEIDAVRRRDVSLMSVYSEGADQDRHPILDGLMRPDSPVTCLMGPRGTGKSISLTAAATQLNYNYAHRQGKIAVQLSCTAITDAVADTMQQVAPSDSEVKFLVLAAVILEFYCNLKRIEILHDKLVGLSASLFPWALGDRVGTTPLLTTTIAGVEHFLGAMKEIDRKKSETDLSSIHLHGATALLRMVRGEAAADPVNALRQEYRNLCGAFLEALERAGVRELYLFLDDFSEAKLDVQRVIQDVCSELFNQTSGRKLRVFFRAAVYWGDNFELTSRANVAPGGTISTDPFRKFLRSQSEMGQGTLDKDMGTHILNIIAKRAKLFNVGRALDCFDGISTETDLRELCTFLGAASGGSIRLIGQILSDLIQRRLNSGVESNIRLDRATIKDHCVTYIDENEDTLLRTGLDSNSKSPEMIRYYQNTWDWLREQLRAGENGVLVKSRFLMGNKATVDYLKPFVNSGLMYVWSQISFKNWPPATGPSYVVAISEAVRLANRRLTPDEELIALGKINVDYLATKFTRSQETLSGFGARRLSGR